jgi:biopolymer transport protein ExbB/TolQ
MSLTSFLFGAMNIIASSLMAPVLIILAIIVLSTLMQLGEFLSEYTKRHRDWSSLETNCKKIQNDLQNSDFSEASRTLENIKQNYMVTSFARETAKYLEGKQISTIGKLSQEYEIKMAKRLEFTKIISTIGPMLGLMATLIPLGPALLFLLHKEISNPLQNT